MTREAVRAIVAVCLVLLAIRFVGGFVTGCQIRAQTSVSTAR
jgi:hypothetical protein